MSCGSKRCHFLRFSHQFFLANFRFCLLETRTRYSNMKWQTAAELSNISCPENAQLAGVVRNLRENQTWRKVRGARAQVIYSLRQLHRRNAGVSAKKSHLGEETCWLPFWLCWGKALWLQFSHSSFLVFCCFLTFLFLFSQIRWNISSGSSIRFAILWEKSNPRRVKLHKASFSSLRVRFILRSKMRAIKADCVFVRHCPWKQRNWKKLKSSLRLNSLWHMIGGVSSFQRNETRGASWVTKDECSYGVSCCIVLSKKLCQLCIKMVAKGPRILQNRKGLRTFWRRVLF